MQHIREVWKTTERNDGNPDRLTFVGSLLVLLIVLLLKTILLDMIVFDKLRVIRKSNKVAKR